ncbi:MAG TPA: hypothetical protein VF720_03275 [Candidatus Eisenbacteria bacterium]
MHLLRSLLVATVLTVLTASVVGAQTRSVTTGGTATGSGVVKITIEDFGKPGRHDLAPQSRLQAVYEVDVNVIAGWTCAQTTQAMYNALLAALPPEFIVAISKTNPCILYIAKELHGTAPWGIEVIVTVPGQVIDVTDGVVPVQPTAWSAIKMRGWNRFN